MKNVHTKTTTQYAVVNNNGDYYSESSQYTFEEARLYKSKKGADNTAKLWGSMCQPRPVNEVVEVEVRTTRIIR